MYNNFVLDALDKSKHPTEFYYFPQGFTPEECDLIHEHALEFQAEMASIESGGDYDAISTYRRSTIRWMHYNEKTHWVYERFGNLLNEANQIWGFDTVGFGESIQYTEYHDYNEGMYDWHVDAGTGLLSNRKISIVVQLDDPKDYEGGDLLIKRGAGEEAVFKAKGAVVMFPSFMLHRVTPVTRGLRRSGLLWATGPSFR